MTCVPPRPWGLGRLRPYPESAITSGGTNTMNATQTSSDGSGGRYDKDATSDSDRE